MPCDRGPALVVNAPVAEHLEVLCLMPFSSLCVVERVRHADTLDRVLLDSVDEKRFGQTRQFKNGRRNVNHVMELAADFAFPLDPLGPVHLGGGTPSPRSEKRTTNCFVGKAVVRTEVYAYARRKLQWQG